MCSVSDDGRQSGSIVFSLNWAVYTAFGGNIMFDVDADLKRVAYCMGRPIDR